MSCVSTCEVKVRFIYSGLLTIFPYQFIELSVLCGLETHHDQRLPKLP